MPTCHDRARSGPVDKVYHWSSPGIVRLNKSVNGTSPRIVAAARDLQNLTCQRNRPLIPVIQDELKPQFFSLAKKAAAFFNISRSIRRRLFSARSRLTSSLSESFSREEN